VPHAFKTNPLSFRRLAARLTQLNLKVLSPKSPKKPAKKLAGKTGLTTDNDRDLAQLFAVQDADFIIGLDEVGRGCLAGPVFSGAFCYRVTSASQVNASFAQLKICDSKILKAEDRQASECQLLAKSHDYQAFVSEASVEEIDTINIHHASLLAMTRSFEEALKFVGDNFLNSRILILVDGSFIPHGVLELCRRAGPNWSVKSVVKGDTKSFAIAASSIVAKEARDRFMKKLATLYPGYAWDKNVGYGTPDHRRALLQLGECVWHRKSFKWQAPAETVELAASSYSEV